MKRLLLIAVALAMVLAACQTAPAPAPLAELEDDYHAQEYEPEPQAEPDLEPEPEQEPEPEEPDEPETPTYNVQFTPALTDQERHQRELDDAERERLFETASRSSWNTGALLNYLRGERGLHGPPGALSADAHGGLHTEWFSPDPNLSRYDFATEDEYFASKRDRLIIWVVDRQAVDAAIAAYTGDMSEVTIVFNQARASYRALFDLQQTINQRGDGNPLASVFPEFNEIRIWIPTTDDGSFRREVDALIAASGVSSAAISIDVIDIHAPNINFIPAY